jgi:hypothetical protein
MMMCFETQIEGFSAPVSALIAVDRARVLSFLFFTPLHMRWHGRLNIFGTKHI